MKIIFFINKTNGFAKQMVSYIEGKFETIEKEYYIVDRRIEENLPDMQNVHRILSYKEFLFNKELIENIKNADKIIVSGVFTLQYVLPIFGCRVLEKTCWQFWGGDYTIFRKNENSIHIWKRVHKAIVSHCLRYAESIVLLTKPERAEFVEMFPFAADKKMYYTPVPSGLDDDELIASIRDGKNTCKNNGQARTGLGENVTTDCKRIVIGNSATDTNRHLEIFEKLSKVSLENVELYCPLSYGEDSYREIVIQKGKELFGERFVPITEYMEYTDYVSFLNTCDVGIYNHNRQQALGNIRRMLELGKKVYLPRIIQDYFDEYGYITWSVDSIEESNTQDIFDFPAEAAQHNIECIKKRNEDTDLTWKSILLD